jgi:hypothetical protein
MTRHLPPVIMHRANGHKAIQLGLMLVVCLFLSTPITYAAPVVQNDPAAQCAEGVRLFNEGKHDQALPL